MNNAGQGFGQKHLGHDLNRAGAHGLGGFDQAAIDFANGAFDNACDERDRRHGQRDNRRRCADRGADDKPGERNDRNGQNDEGHGTGRIDDRTKDALEPKGFKQFPPAGRRQKHAKRQPHRGAKRQGSRHHIKGFAGCLKQDRCEC